MRLCLYYGRVGDVSGERVVAGLVQGMEGWVV